ncbi:mechanosensitive ion channel domain-containing protein [Alistipes putredinis]|uniref:mechanosensitive ion channel domain-containing protein n=1 Tax=Alistipes putredinis TaxID=28117 RepID=UPI0039941AB3
MLRIGDWIEMPQNGINGTVTDISLTVIKVQNFDNTIVTRTSVLAGLRIVRQLAGHERFGRIAASCANTRSNSDCTSNPARPKFLERMKAFDEEPAQFIAEKQRQAAEGKVANTENPDGLVSGTIETESRSAAGLHGVVPAPAPLRQPRPALLMVRTLPATENGLPVQIYCFSSTRTGRATNPFRLRLWSTSSPYYRPSNSTHSSARAPATSSSTASPLPEKPTWRRWRPLPALRTLRKSREPEIQPVRDRKRAHPKKRGIFLVRNRISKSQTGH